MTKTLVKMMAVPALALAAACSRGDQRPAADPALQNDLALAGAQQPYQPQQYVSPQEQGYANSAYPQAAPRGYAPAPVYAPARPSTVRRSSSSASRSTGSSSGTYTPAPRRTETVRNTGRDAAIGAGAGAVIGAVTSKDKVKGGVIGAVAGGVLGGVFGHNVDKKKTTVP